MLAWRIAKPGDIDDLSGAGAALFGGRWNHPERFALYLGLSPAGCALDPFILAGHVPRLPLKLMTLRLPDDPGLYLEPCRAELPTGWDALPADSPGMDFGSRWLDRGEQLGLILPSVAMEQARCLLINPAHPAFNRIEVVQVEDFSLGRSAAVQRWVSTTTLPRT
jgi:RES domain-containing protein